MAGEKNVWVGGNHASAFAYQPGKTCINNFLTRLIVAPLVEWGQNRNS